MRCPGMWFADLLYSMEFLVPYIGNIDRVQVHRDVEVFR